MWMINHKDFLLTFSLQRFFGGTDTKHICGYMCGHVRISPATSALCCSSADCRVVHPILLCWKRSRMPSSSLVMYKWRQITFSGSSGTLAVKAGAAEATQVSIQVIYYDKAGFISLLWKVLGFGKIGHPEIRWKASFLSNGNLVY